MLLIVALAALVHILPAVHGQSAPPANGSTISGFSEADSMNGRISSLLLPAATGDSMMMDSGSMYETRQEAMRFSMALDVTWVLSGKWSLSGNGSAAEFDAAFTKVATDGTMRHSHKIDNLMLPADALAIMKTDPGTIVISGAADVYFNDELAWKQAGIELRVHGGVLVIMLEGIDSHFHDMPIYGVVAMPKNPAL